MVEYIIMAVVAAVLFAVSIAVVYSVLSGIDYSGVDAVWGDPTNITPAQNASDSVISNLDTFYSVGPIYIVVIAAVAIIGAIMYLRKEK